MSSNIQLRKLPCLEPMWSWGDWTHLVIRSGRALGKSHQGAKWAIYNCLNRPNTRILVTRQFFESLNESMFTTIKTYLRLIAKARPHMAKYWSASESKKDCWIKFSNGSEMLFYGVDRYPESLKGIEDIQILIADEVQTYSHTAFTMLTDTIVRNSGIKCLWLGNRTNRTDTWEHRLIDPGEAGDPDIKVLALDYRQNIFLYTDDGTPNRTKFKEFWNWVERMERNDPDLYQHTYLGDYNRVSDSIVFRRCRQLKTAADTTAFEAAIPASARWFYGLDWSHGGADPHALVELAVWEDNIYLAREVALYGEDTDVANYPRLLHEGMAEQGQPDIRAKRIYCDVMPILTKHLKDSGWTGLVPASKPAGSRIKAYREMGLNQLTFSHRCAGAYKEFSEIRYELDKDTGRPKSPPKIPDGQDHRIDASGYALREYLSRPAGPVSTGGVKGSKFLNQVD